MKPLCTEIELSLTSLRSQNDVAADYLREILYELLNPHGLRVAVRPNSDAPILHIEVLRPPTKTT